MSDILDKADCPILIVNGTPPLYRPYDLATKLRARQYVVQEVPGPDMSKIARQSCEGGIMLDLTADSPEIDVLDRLVEWWVSVHHPRVLIPNYEKPEEQLLIHAVLKYCSETGLLIMRPDDNSVTIDEFCMHIDDYRAGKRVVIE